MRGFIVGMLVGLGLCVGPALYLLNARDRAIERAQQFSDSLATVAIQRDSVATHFSDSLLAVVDSLTARKDSVVHVALVDSHTVAQLDTALALATTLEERNTLLTLQVKVLKNANQNLWVALALSDSMTARLRLRGDSLLTALNTATTDILRLNARVQALQPRFPKLLRYSLEAAKLLVVAKAGYELGQASN